MSRRAVLALSVVPAATLLSVVGMNAAQASKPIPTHKVTLCHRTGSADGGNQHDGYDLITVDIASVANAKDVRGHDGHNHIGNGPIGDIIPSFTYGTFTYPGKNLDAGGMAILANGCRAVESTPSPTPGPSLTPTPTPEPTSTEQPGPTPTPGPTTPPVVVISEPPPSRVVAPPVRHRALGQAKVLPFTGDHTGAEMLLGMTLLGTGAALTRLGRPRTSR